MSAWRGDDATAWLRRTDAIYQSMSAKLAKQIHDLRDQETELMDERRIIQSESDDDKHDDDEPDDDESER